MEIPTFSHPICKTPPTDTQTQITLYRVSSHPSINTNLPTMSNQSIADTFTTTVKEVKKTDANAKPGITSPPHFGDVGKAANDTFSKVPLSLPPSHSPPTHNPQIASPILPI